MTERARARRRVERAQSMSDLRAAVWSDDLRRAVDAVLDPPPATEAGDRDE